MHTCRALLIFFNYCCSSFDEHFGYKLSIEEIKDLTKGKRKDKWKEKWEVAANNKSRCKWIGTGEPFMEVHVSELITLCLHLRSLVSVSKILIMSIWQFHICHQDGITKTYFEFIMPPNLQRSIMEKQVFWNE